MQNAHDTYLEGRILAADPLELVRLLYRGAIAAVQDAQYHLREGRIAERARAISKTCAILFELHHALDRERGGEIAQRLGALYDYMERRLLEANAQQSEPPLTEVLGLLTTLSEAWAGISQPEEAEPAAASPWSQSAPEPLSASSSSTGWSL